MHCFLPPTSRDRIQSTLRRCKPCAKFRRPAFSHGRIRSSLLDRSAGLPGKLNRKPIVNGRVDAKSIKNRRGRVFVRQNCTNSTRKEVPP